MRVHSVHSLRCSWSCVKNFNGVFLYSRRSFFFFFNIQGMLWFSCSINKKKQNKKQYHECYWHSYSAPLSLKKHKGDLYMSMNALQNGVMPSSKSRVRHLKESQNISEKFMSIYHDIDLIFRYLHLISLCCCLWIQSACFLRLFIISVNRWSQW